MQKSLLSSLCYEALVSPINKEQFLSYAIQEMHSSVRFFLFLSARCVFVARGMVRTLYS